MESRSRSKSPSKSPSRSPSRSKQPTLLKRSLSKMFEQEPSFGKESKATNLKYISGPVSWTGFEFGNKAVHFFGDKHYSKENGCEELNEDIECFDAALSVDYSYYAKKRKVSCMSIDGLIKAIYETSGEKNDFYADFFYEYPYETKKKRRGKYEVYAEQIGFLAVIHDYTVDIINHVFSEKVNPRANFHPIDIRVDWTKSDTEIPRLPLDLFSLIPILIFQGKTEIPRLPLDSQEIFANDILDLFKKGELDYYKSKNYILFIKNLINQLSNWKDKTIYHRNFLLSLEKIYAHVTTHGMGGKIENTMFASIRMLESLNKKQITFKGINISEYIQKFFETQLNELMNKNKNVTDVVEYLENTMLKLGESIMDIATLTKLFKRLANDEPQVIIVYAGDSHIESYVKFFTQILGLKPLPGFVNRATKPNRCLINKDFSEIFGKWIDLDIPTSPKKSKRATKSIEITTPKKSKRETKSIEITTPKKSKSETKSIQRTTPRKSKSETKPIQRTTPRKSNRTSKPIERFSEQYNKFY
jgi:hypothetical protein